MKKRQLIQRITQHTEMTEDEVEEKAQILLEENNCLKNKSTAIHYLALEENVDIDQDFETELKIKNLVPGLYDNTVTAEVTRVFSTNTFDGGKVKNVEISDETGSTQLTFWNELTEIAGLLTVGNKIKIKGAKSDYNDYHNKTVLHVQKKTRITDLDYDMVIKK